MHASALKCLKLTKEYCQVPVARCRLKPEAENRKVRTGNRFYSLIRIPQSEICNLKSILFPFLPLQYPHGDGGVGKGAAGS